MVTSSVSRMPNDQTSDLMVNFPYRAASGAVHFMGNLAPEEQGERERERGRDFSQALLETANSRRATEPVLRSANGLKAYRLNTHGHTLKEEGSNLIRTRKRREAEEGT